MAIINCPDCRKRISDHAPACKHCGLPLGEMSSDEIKNVARRRWRKRVYTARNTAYLGMATLVAGAIWWFMYGTGGGGLVLPPPPATVVLLTVGAVVYLGGRAWVFWLTLKRNRPG